MQLLRVLPTRGLAALALLAVLPATPRAAGEPDIVDMALGWTRGTWSSPLVCSLEGASVRGLRRVVIARGPRRSLRRANRIDFHDLQADGAERCSSALGGEQINLVGGAMFTYEPRRPGSDTPKRDFSVELRRGALEFAIKSGTIRVGPVNAPRDTLRAVDFAGGRLLVKEIPPGSDLDRLLLEFGPQRKLELVIEAPDGTRFEMPLVALRRR